MIWCEWVATILFVAIMLVLLVMSPHHFAAVVGYAFWTIALHIFAFVIAPIWVVLRLIDLAVGGPRWRARLRARSTAAGRLA